MFRKMGHIEKFLLLFVIVQSLVLLPVMINASEPGEGGCLEELRVCCRTNEQCNETDCPQAEDCPEGTTGCTYGTCGNNDSAECYYGGGWVPKVNCNTLEH